MKNLKGALIFAQSGGPTSVINASASGVFLEALKNKNITEVYGAAYGIGGILTEQFYDIKKEDKKELEMLKYTPASAMGSIRHKLADPKFNDTDYKKILQVFKKYNVRFFLYNGGNDSMDTCNKISKYMQKAGYDVNIIGVPKTIDNDLALTDHCPGFASTAKYIATTIMELSLDTKVYDLASVIVVEAMGRHAGWLTASAELANINGKNADLIYLPEVPFSVEKFVSDVKGVMDKNRGQCIVCVSEGVRDSEGKLIAEVLGEQRQKDVFGHTQLGGVSSLLSDVIKQKLGVKTRAVELSTMQRCSSHIASQTDIEEASNAGKWAVKYATQGESDKMVAYKRKSGDKYACEYVLVPLDEVANKEKTVPLEWIINDGTGLSKEFVDYALPLIQGETKQEKQNGLPRFAKLKKVLVEKK